MYEDIRNQCSYDSINQASRPDWIREAGKWELKGGATSYEGGLSTPADGVTANLANQIMAHRSERMIRLIQYNLANSWYDLGGGLAMYFTLVSGYNRYGAWGLTDDLRNPDRNYKMEALRHLQTITGIEIPDSQDRPLVIYPNPSEGMITVKEGTFPGSFHIVVEDLLGRNVFEKLNFNSGAPLDLNFAPDGIYRVITEDSKCRISFTLVIKH